MHRILRRSALAVAFASVVALTPSPGTAATAGKTHRVDVRLGADRASPGTAKLTGTVRYFNRNRQVVMKLAMKDLCPKDAYGVELTASVKYGDNAGTGTGLKDYRVCTAEGPKVLEYTSPAPTSGFNRTVKRVELYFREIHRKTFQLGDQRTEVLRP